MSTRVPSAIRGFASNVYECIPVMVHKRPLECVIDAVAFAVHITNETHRPSVERP